MNKKSKIPELLKEIANDVQSVKMDKTGRINAYDYLSYAKKTFEIIEMMKNEHDAYVFSLLMSNKHEQVIKILKLVNEQAEDDGLWFKAEHASEAYLQKELRRLHFEIENMQND